MSRVISLLKTNNIIKVSPSENLSAVLNKLSTSHDAAFVFDNGRYLGVINPYYSVIRFSYPANTKVAHCLFHPPRVYLNTPINKVAKFFIESKIHYLPVFNEKDEFLGIVSARRFLTLFQNSGVFKISIENYLKIRKKPLYVVGDKDNISRAISIFKEKRISKLVVVDNQMKLKGILSYYDLIDFLAIPKISVQRGDRVGTKINFYHYSVNQFAKTLVLTLQLKDSLERVLNLILEKKIGSVVIVDDQRHPQAIITTKDLLLFFIQQKTEKKVEFIFKNLSTENRQIIGGFFDRFNSFVNLDSSIEKARLLVKEEKQGGLFQIVFSLFKKTGQVETIKREGKSLPKILTPLTHLIKTIVRPPKKDDDNKK